MSETRVKICGLRTEADVAAVAAAGAAYMGLVFFPRSPRYVSLEQARKLALAAPEGLAKVALVVDADDRGARCHRRGGAAGHAAAPWA